MFYNSMWKFRLAVAIMAFFALIIGPSIWAQGYTNPLTSVSLSGASRHTNSSGKTDSYNVEWACPKNGTAGRYIPSYSNFNNKKTSKGTGIQNVDTTGFAWGSTLTIPNGKGGGENVTVTQATSDLAWDEHYATTRGGGWTRVSSSGFDRNCYGYATKRTFWVEEPGFVIITADEYEVEKAHQCMEGGIIKYSGEDHSGLLDSCCDKNFSGTYNTIKELSEKVGTGGLYKKSWTCSANPNDPDPAKANGGALELIGKGAIYKKKP